jgi:hypothetical protein
MESKCGNCSEFFPGLSQCGHPMVYLNHTTNEFATTDETKGCGFYSPDPRKAQEPKK